jgi:hypothetical protein
MAVRDNGAGVRAAADGQRLRSLVLVLLTVVGLSLIVLGVVGSRV